MGYGAETTTDEVLEGVDLSGRVAVVTGASTGLGLETARALASAGARVVLGVRGRERGEAALARITERVPHAELELELVDLASLESVRAFTDRVLARHALLHLVVANAGVMYTPFGRTAEGFELQFGTNHVGHFVLVNRLVPALVVGAPSRVVVLSSAGHHGADIDWDDPNFERRPYDKFSAYSQSKTANVLFALELDRRLASRGVHAYSVHPGMIATELGRHMTRDDFRELKERAKRGPSGGLPAYKSVEAGAATTVWAAVEPELDATGGAYLADCQVSTPAPWAADPDAAARLWSLTERLVGERFDI